MLESEIKSLSSSLTTSRVRTVTSDGTGTHLVFAYPKSWGLAVALDPNSLEFRDWLLGASPYEVTITNQYGIVTDYYVYHTFNEYYGSNFYLSWS
jgi:hypothetical protein